MVQLERFDSLKFSSNLRAITALVMKNPVWTTQLQQQAEVLYYEAGNLLRDARQFYYDLSKAVAGSAKHKAIAAYDSLEDSQERLQAIHVVLTESAGALDLVPPLSFDIPVLGYIDPLDSPADAPPDVVRLANGLTPAEQEEKFWLERGMITKPFSERVNPDDKLT